MISTFKTQLSSLGFLRLGLLGLSILTMLLPIIEWGVIQSIGELSERSLLALSSSLIGPVMAPTLIVVLLLDIIMAKVRAADDSADSSNVYRLASCVSTIMIFVMLLFWVPYFILVI
jgi:hypothetical protein